MTTKVKKLKALLIFAKMSVANLIVFINTILSMMTGNAAFPTPPVTMADLKVANDALTVLAAAAADGGKKAIGEKNKQQSIAVKMLEQLAHYVEAASNDDPVTFQSSGFTPAPSTRAPATALSVPVFGNVNQANTGQMSVQVKRDPKAISYGLRYAALGAGGTPGQWTTLPMTSTKITVSGLTPGTAYLFQVQALGKLGYTDWSDAVTRISL